MSGIELLANGNLSTLVEGVRVADDADVVVELHAGTSAITVLVR